MNTSTLIIIENAQLALILAITVPILNINNATEDYEVNLYNSLLKFAIGMYLLKYPVGG